MIRRYLQCSDCKFAWVALQDKGDPLPECPQCTAMKVALDVDAEAAADQARLQRMLDSGIPPAKKSPRARAVEYMQRIAEEDYSLTNMRTGAKDGESIVISPSAPQTAESEEITRKMIDAGLAPPPAGDEVKRSVQTFWGAAAPGSMAAPAQNPAQMHPLQMAVQQTVAGAVASSPAAARQARAEGVDPIAILHAAGKAGKLGKRYRPVGFARAS